MVKRSEKVAFMEITSNDTTKYVRMKEFTEMTLSKNPKEYNRKYIDEDAERTDVVSYAPSISYKFDYNPENAVHQRFVNISDSELVGEATKVTIVIVDLSAPSTTGGSSFNCIKRDFKVIPNSEGDDQDTFTYSGNLKAAGAVIKGTATTTDEWQEATFAQASA